MAYVKNIWVDQDVERPKTYEVTNNQDGSITLTDSFGLVTELGTPVNEVNMNHIEDGIDGCAIRKHNLTETFNLGEWVLGGTGDDEGIYKSLIANNVNNAITDDTKWEKVEMGGSSRNIGEIVASTIPLTDAGLHLLDGSLLQYGSYQAFIDYIADLYDSGDYTAIFDTEANWQAAVTDYGVCGKFVYDSVNNTVRLPKYSNIIYTKDITSTAPVKGTGKTLGYTNGTLEFGTVIYNPPNGSNLRTAMLNTDAINKDVGTSLTQTNSSTSGLGIGITTDGSKSGIIADLSNITAPLEGYYYIVIATSSKTDIQVDIDEIATDLNGKADVDLTNINSSCKPLDGQWVNSYHVLTESTAVGTYTLDLSTFLPNDNYMYDVKIVHYYFASTTGTSYYKYSNDVLSDAGSQTWGYANSASRNSALCFDFPVSTQRYITFAISDSAASTVKIAMVGYRRIGTNQ